MNYCFAVSVHARPAEAVVGPAAQLGGQAATTLSMDPLVLARQPFDQTFETTIERLSRLERMFCEPDGSFVWTSSAGAAPWQVDGNLFDRDGRLLFVDLKGVCPAEDFDRLLTAFGWPATAVVFQLTRQALFLDEAEFRRTAECS